MSESALTRTIREVRRSLGALAGRPWIRTVYFALVGALEAGLVRTAEDPLTVLRRRASRSGRWGRNG